jgi:uncharacterized protein (DUF427 family)
VTAAPSPPLLEDIQLWPALDADQRVRLEPTGKRVRAFLGATAVADSTRVMMMFEAGRLPVYYFPVDDVRTDLFKAGSRSDWSPQKGQATYWSVAVDDLEAPDAAWRYLDPMPGCSQLSGYVAFHWRAMSAWFEEDEEVFGHARDPYHRIDVLDSTRHVRVALGGQTLAETDRPRLLFETSLPTRYYIPRLDVRLDLLRHAERRTSCAYKGTTSDYWAAVAEDGSLKEVAWSYRSPSAECARIANLVCFFNERVDVYVDGSLLTRPQTPWA